MSRQPQDPAAPPGELVEVGDGVFAYLQPDGSWFLNNAGFVAGRGGVVAVDACSTERRTRALRAAIGQVTAAPVRTLVNTHSHGDHTYGNYLFRPAAVVAHTRCREEVLAAGVTAPAGVWTPVDWGGIEPEPPFVTFPDRLDLHVDDLRVELHHIGGPAHTTGDAVAWIPDRSVLFSGDLVFNGGTPFVVGGSVSGSLKALDTLRAFGATTIVPGHGPVCGPEVLDGIADYLRFVQATAQQGHQAGIGPLQAARQTDLGPFASLSEPERLVGNLHRAYAELDGAEPGAPLAIAPIFADMVAYNGGRPLPCRA